MSKANTEFDAVKLSAEALEIAKQIKSRFPNMADLDCGKWAKFVVMSGHCINRFGIENAETVIKHTASECLK